MERNIPNSWEECKNQSDLIWFYETEGTCNPDGSRKKFPNFQAREFSKTLDRQIKEDALTMTERKDIAFVKTLERRGLNVYDSKLSSLRTAIKDSYGYEKLWVNPGSNGVCKKYLEELEPDSLRRFAEKRYDNGYRISKNLAAGLDKKGKR